MAPLCCLKGLLFMSLLLSVLCLLALRFLLSFNVGWLYFRGESVTFISIRLIQIEVWKTTWDPRWGSTWPFHTPALLYTEISSSRAKGFCRQVDSNHRRPYTGSTLAPGSKSALAPGGVRVRTVGYVGMESFLSFHIILIFRTYPRTVLRKAHSFSGFASKVETQSPFLLYGENVKFIQEEFI